MFEHAELDPDTGKRWCEKCQEWREEIETYEHYEQEYRGQYGGMLTILECNHNSFRRDGSFYPFP